jgi:hypothetical protein
VNPIFAAALEVQEFCRARGFRFCFIGGLALQRWGEPRLTQGVDLTVISGFGREPEYADQFLATFASRIPDGREFALRHRVLLLLGRDGIPLDVALGAMPFEERAVSRAPPFLVAEGASLKTSRRGPDFVGSSSTQRSGGHPHPPDACPRVTSILPVAPRCSPETP